MENFENIITENHFELKDKTPNKNESEPSNVGEDILHYFNSLDWNVVDKSEYRSCLASFLPSEEGEGHSVKSHALGLIYSQRYLYPEQEYDLKLIPEEEDKSWSFYVPGVEGNTIIYPSNSSLTRKEQNLLYVFYCRNHFQNPPLDQSEFFTYQELMGKAIPEHNTFQTFVQSEWIKHHCGRSLAIPASVQEYIDRLWRTRSKQCIALYPPLYKSEKYHIPLILNDPNGDYSVMEFSKVLLLRGVAPKMSLPSLKKRCDLITDLDKLCKIEPVLSEGEEIPVKAISRPVLPVSIDPNVDMCVQRENIDVVITCSGIKSIVDIYNSRKGWILPVIVKKVLKVNGEVEKKVVIIDKNLPPSAMSVYDKNVWHAKIAAKWTLILNSAPTYFDKEQPPGPKPSFQERELTQYDETVTEVVEEFGVDTGPSKFSWKTKVGKRQKCTDGRDKIRSEKEKVCDILDPSGTICKTEVGQRQESTDGRDKSRSEKENVCDKLDPSGTICKTEVDKRQESTDGRDKSRSEKENVCDKLENLSIIGNDIEEGEIVDNKSAPVSPDGMKRKSWSDNSPTMVPSFPTTEDIFLRPKLIAKRQGPITPCLNYKLWELHKSTHFNMSKQEQRSLKVLVRNTLDGTLAYYKNNRRLTGCVYVTSKLEYQPEYGASKMDKSELVREYVDIFIRQANICRVRTVGHTKELMLHEVKSLSDIKDSLHQVHKVETHKVFDPLYAVLTKLIDQPVGRYLLQQTPKMGAFANLLVENQQSTSFNLSTHCERLQAMDVNLPAAQIDPFVLTRLHYRDRFPPALFKPNITNTGKFFKKPSFPIPAKRKKNKKKKKSNKV